MKEYIIGIDIGGTNMKAILWDGEKTIMDYSLATPKDSLDHLIIMIGALVEPLIEKSIQLKKKVGGIGLSISGTHDLENGIIIKSPNLELLEKVEIKKILEKKFNLPIKLDNDANCFLLAEATIGAGKKYNNIYGIIISTGIGGAWYFNKKIYRGSNNGAGEPGAMIIDFTNPINLEDGYQKLNQNNSLNLATEAWRGDELAKRAYQEIGNLLGVACSTIVNLIDPEIIIIGGGTTKASDLFLKQTKKTMSEYTFNPDSKKTKLLKGKIGEDAGAIGAALLFS